MVLLILNPHIPMLFMGEEAAAETPFLFFTDWKGEAANLTREGRRKEFANFKAFSTPELRKKIPHPCDEGTFIASKLDWGVPLSYRGAREACIPPATTLGDIARIGVRYAGERADRQTDDFSAVALDAMISGWPMLTT